MKFLNQAGHLAGIFICIIVVTITMPLLKARATDQLDESFFVRPTAELNQSIDQNSDETLSTPRHLYMSFEKRLLLSYILNTYHQNTEEKEATLKSMRNFFSTLRNSPKKVVKIKSFVEFLRYYRGDWPDTHSLEMDLKIIEQRGFRPLLVYEFSSQRVERKAARFIVEQNAELFKILDRFQVADYFHETIDRITESRDIEGGLRLTDRFIDSVFKKVNDLCFEFASEKFKHIKDPAFRVTFEILIKRYFDLMSVSSKKRMANAFLGENLNMDDMGRFNIFIQNSGPILQQFFQVIANRDGIPADLQAELQKLENSVNEVPWVLVEPMVKRESQYYDFIYFERKPLAVGSMAQIHRAKIRLHKKILSIIVRFIKPGIAARLEEDREILTTIAREIDRHPVYISTGNPKLSPLIGDIVQTAVVELHQPTAIDLQSAATRAYASEKRIEGKDFAIIFQTRAPAVLAHRPGSMFMIQEMVFGQSIRSFAERWGKLYPNIEQKIIEAIAEKWIVTLLFGSGLYHSDLHPGNFLVDIKDGMVTANLLDYGKGGHITREMQNRILYLGLAVRARDPRVIADALWGISDKNKNQIDFLLLRMLIEYESLVARSHNLEMDFGRWTAWALNNGLVLPYDLISMNRGQLTINENLQRYRSRFDLGDFAIKYAERHPFEVYDRLVNELKIPTYVFLKAARIPILERIGKQLSRKQNLCDPAL